MLLFTLNIQINFKVFLNRKIPDPYESSKNQNLRGISGSSEINWVAEVAILSNKKLFLSGS